MTPSQRRQEPTTNVSSTCAILGNRRRNLSVAARETPTVRCCRSRREETEVTADVSNIRIDDLSGESSIKTKGKLSRKLISVFSFGICLQDSELLMCYDHDECPDDMPCVVGYCGEKQYFEAIGDIECENDEVCKVCNSIMA